MIEDGTCDNCRFWSDLVAKFEGGRVQALCLSQFSEWRHKYTSEGTNCERWQLNTHGSHDFVSEGTYPESEEEFYGARWKC